MSPRRGETGPDPAATGIDGFSGAFGTRAAPSVAGRQDPTGVGTERTEDSAILSDPAALAQESSLDTITDYDDVTQYGLDDDLRDEILRKQIECTFIWGPKDHWAVGVLMTYLWRDGSFWVSATSQRKRIAAIRRDPRVSIVVSSHGTDLGPAKGITAKGRAVIHDDRATRDWFYPACAAVNIPTAGKLQDAFAHMMDTERRLVIEVVPEKWITFDAAKMMQASIPAWRKMGLLE